VNNRETVGVSVVRELKGVMAVRGALGAFLVTSGSCTAEAVAFAAEAHIELVQSSRRPDWWHVERCLTQIWAVVLRIAARGMFRAYWIPPMTGTLFAAIRRNYISSRVDFHQDCAVSFSCRRVTD